MFIQPQKDNGFTSQTRFQVKSGKNVLEPTQSITFLGLQIDSVSMKLLVPKEKKKSIKKEIRNFLKLDCCSPRKLAGLKGKLIALKDAVIPFRLYTHVKRDFTLVNSLKPMEWKGNQSISKLRLCSHWKGNGSVRISHEPPNVQLLNNQNELKI
ncbi:hypothetical protein ACTFIR_012789 [Dictyostelium discoideum]